jgi:hypothetical protein
MFKIVKLQYCKAWHACLLFFTVEIEDMLVRENTSLGEVVSRDLDHLVGDDGDGDGDGGGVQLYGREGSSSGGFLHHVLVNSAQEIFGVRVDKLEFKQIRSVYHLSESSAESDVRRQIV